MHALGHALILEVVGHDKRSASRSAGPPGGGGRWAHDEAAARGHRPRGGASALPSLDVQSLWFDESFTIIQLRRPLGEFLSEIETFQSTPPLYYLLAWPWERAFGEGQVAMRWLSAILGTATVPVVYLAGKTLFSRTAGLLAHLSCLRP